nr:myelin basic protein-specific T cell receptor V alpha chain {clone 1B1} [mice, SJL, mesenteric lymph nodes, regulatory T cells, Peptide Partial, 26 aa] [Mus sp.]
CAVRDTGYQNFYFGKGTSLTVIPNIQ